MSWGYNWQEPCIPYFEQNKTIIFLSEKIIVDTFFLTDSFPTTPNLPMVCVACKIYSSNIHSGSVDKQEGPASLAGVLHKPCVKHA